MSRIGGIINEMNNRTTNQQILVPLILDMYVYIALDSKNGISFKYIIRVARAPKATPWIRPLIPLFKSVSNKRDLPFQQKQPRELRFQGDWKQHSYKKITKWFNSK